MGSGLFDIGDWFIEIVSQNECVYLSTYIIGLHERIVKSCPPDKNVYLVIWKVDVTHYFMWTEMKKSSQALLLKNNVTERLHNFWVD